MSDRLGLLYWLTLIRNDVRWYGRRRKWLALARVLWARIIDHDNAERCELCGRGYFVWVASDEVYRRVIGGPGGLFCPTCFDALAEALGLTLAWAAHPCPTMEDLNRLCDDLAAFR